MTLVHAGYEDLNYTVQSGDGPSLTLRMLRHHHGGDAVAHQTPAAPPPRGAAAARTRGRTRRSVDTFDDGDKAPHVPKVHAHR